MNNKWVFWHALWVNDNPKTIITVTFGKGKSAQR